MNIITNLEDFGYRELGLAGELLSALAEQGAPEDFDNDGIHVVFNTQSGYVFLSNSEYQVLMLNGDTLEMWYSCPECGQEGFADEIDWNEETCTCGDCAEEEEEEEEE